MGIRISDFVSRTAAAGNFLLHATTALTSKITMSDFADWLVGTYGSITQAGVGAVASTLGVEVKYWVRPEQFGTGVGTGSDDTTAIQRAITSLVNTGGAVWFDPRKIYRVSSQINIQSRYPIHLWSQMTGFPSLTAAGGHIAPIAAITGSMFKYSSPTGTRSDAGGGTVYGLSFRDLTGSGETPGTNTVSVAALELFDFNLGKVKDNAFHFINGSAIKTVFCVMTDIEGNLIRYSGATSQPALYILPTDATFTTQSTNIVNNRLEVCYLAPYISINTNASQLKLIGNGFEADTSVANSNQNFIYQNGQRVQIIGCHFNRNTALQLNVPVTGLLTTIMGCQFNGTANTTAAAQLTGIDGVMSGCEFNSGKTADEILVDGQRWTITACTFTSSGGVRFTASLNKIADCVMITSTTTNAYWIDLQGSDCTADNNTLQHNTTGTSGGIRIGAVTASCARGNTVKNFVGIGLISSSANSVTNGNVGYQNTGGSMSASTYSPGLGENLMFGASRETYRVMMMDDFEGDVLADQWGTAIGSDGACVAAAVVASAAGGLVRLVTGAGAGATMAVNGSQLHRYLNWIPSKGGFSMEWTSVVNANTSLAWFIGVTNQIAALQMPVTSSGVGDAFTFNAADCCGILYDTAMTTKDWWFLGNKASTPSTAQDLAIAPANGTTERWRLEISSGGTATLYRLSSGAMVPVGSAMSNALTAGTVYTPVIAAFSRTNASRTIDCDYIRMEQGR